MEPHKIAHTVEQDEHSGIVRFRTDKFYFEVNMKDDGKLEIRCSDGALAIFAKSSNMIEVRCEPWWGDKDTARITKHIIDNHPPEEAAALIVDSIRGRR